MKNGDFQTDVVIVGQGLAGSVLAWCLKQAGLSTVLVDDERPRTASRVAAGLVSVLGGRTLTVTPERRVEYRTAKEFYEWLSEQGRKDGSLKGDLFRATPAWRMLSADEREPATERRQQFPDIVSLHAEVNGQTVTQNPRWLCIQEAGRLDVETFLQWTRSVWKQHQAYHNGVVSSEDVAIEEDRCLVRVADQRIVRCRNVVFCRGFAEHDGRWFPDVPDKPSAGTILEVADATKQITGTVRGEGVWVVGDKKGIRVGATFDRSDLTASHRSEEVDSLQERLHQLMTTADVLTGEGRQIRAVRSVRPTMRNRQIVARQHPQEDRLWCFNGLGSHGSRAAPAAAARLAADIGLEHQWDDLPRQTPTDRVTVVAHQLAAERLQPGDTAVDATAGNGHDTVFLAKQVGPAGKVLAIDRQRRALDETRSRITQSGEALAECRLWQGCHRHLEKFIADSAVGVPQVIMLNLGYLPGSDHLVTTTARSTADCIDQGICCLRPGGLMTILSYRGHPGGIEEYRCIKRCLVSRRKDVVITLYPTPGPVLIAVRKGE